MKTRRYIKTVILITITLAISCTKGPEKAAPEDGNVIDAIQLTTLDGNKIDLERLKGKTVFINFWATWCRPCISEMPSIDKLIASLKDENVEFLMASNEPVKKIDGFKKSNDYSFNYVHLSSGLEQLGIQGLPTTFILNKSGELVYSEMGARDWSTEESIQLIKNIENTGGKP